MTAKFVRFPDELTALVAAAAKSQGFKSQAAWIRNALVNELGREKAEEASAQSEKTAKTLARLGDEIAKLRKGQQEISDAVDTLARLMITLLPEPTTADGASAQERYRKFRQAVTKAAALNQSSDVN